MKNIKVKCHWKLKIRVALPNSVREIIWINHIAYMGADILKGGAIFLGHSPLWGGAIFLGYSSPGGGIPRNIAPFWGGESPGGGDKSPVTTAWANSSTFLKILSCPAQNMSLPLKCPPPQILNLRPWSARTLYVYAHADLAQKYSVHGLEEIFVYRLCS
jgi:hypothetical protein